jgi:thiol-disulfide isomerase/thioredoxin
MVLANLTHLATNKYFYIIIAVAAIFIGVAIYIYRRNIAPSIDPAYVDNEEFVDKNGSDSSNANDTAEFMMFYANWCPLSKKAMPVWNEFKETYENKTINNYRLIFNDVDCSDSNDSAMQAKLDSYKVDGFPTIKMLKGNEVIDFDANPTMDSLEQFVSTVIGTSSNAQ